VKKELTNEVEAISGIEIVPAAMRKVHSDATVSSPSPLPFINFVGTSGLSEEEFASKYEPPYQLTVEDDSGKNSSS
jgi:hypothetical protein